MPLFSNRFYSKSAKLRKSTSQPTISRNAETNEKEKESDALRFFRKTPSLGDDINSIKSGKQINSDQNDVDSSTLISKIDTLTNELDKVKSANEVLISENRLLRLKMELLIDLVSFF